MLHGVGAVVGVIGRFKGKVKGACPRTFKDKAVALGSISSVNRDGLLVEIRDLNVLGTGYLFVYAASIVFAHVPSLGIIEMDICRWTEGWCNYIQMPVRPARFYPRPPKSAIMPPTMNKMLNTVLNSAMIGMVKIQPQSL
ncbi:MAG: hypothetical protein WC980_10775 [Candidatus Brocadiia bacterium]